MRTTDCLPDVDHSTIRKGGLQALACIKNDNSHHRARVRRADDEKLLAKFSPI
jgi:hypothetical protein